MNNARLRLTGSLFMIGSIQFILAVIISEALHPGYSPANNLLSELGVGNNSLLFNVSVIVFGVCLLLGAILLFRAMRSVVVSLFIALGGIGAVIVGLAPMNTTGFLHPFGSQMAFVCAGIAAILAARLEKRPLNYFSVILGIISLVSLVLIVGNITFNIAPAGLLERMIAYPELLWFIAFGSFLTTQ